MKISLPWPGLFIKEGDSEKQKRKVIVARTILALTVTSFAIYILGFVTVLCLLCVYIAYIDLRYDVIFILMDKERKTPHEFINIIATAIYAICIFMLIMCSLIVFAIPFDETHIIFLLSLPLYWAVGIKWIGIRLIYNNVKKWIDSAPDA